MPEIDAPSPLLAAMIAAARLGGGIARQHFAACGQTKINEKGARDYVKEADVAVETSRGLARLNDPGQEAFAEIGALQERYAGLWRFYVFVPAQATRRAAAVAGELFGIPSEYSCA